MKKLALLSVVLSALAGCFASCGDKNETQSQQAGVFKIAKTAYSVSDGSKNTASWTAGEECGLLVDGIDENIIGVALNTTESASPFTFAFPSAGRGKACCFYSPRDDNKQQEIDDFYGVAPAMPVDNNPAFGNAVDTSEGITIDPAKADVPEQGATDDDGAF